MVQQTPGPSAGSAQAPGPSTDSAAEERRRLSGGAVASLTGVVLLAIFMIQNREVVTLRFLFWGFTWPLWLFTLTTALIGALIWFGLGVMRRHRRRVARREARRD